MNNFDEILNDLPNGFHDSILKSIFIDYQSDKILLKLDVCIGDPDDPIEEMRDQYASGELEFSEILFYIAEPPATEKRQKKKEEILVDIEGIASLPEEERAKLPSLGGNDSFAVWIYINNTNSFIFICATSAKFKFDLPG